MSDKQIKGFTILELVVALGVLILMVAVLFQIFSNTLRGSNKAQVLATIKQNSQSAIDNIDKTIRISEKVICVSADKSQVVTYQNGIYTRFGFSPPTATPQANGFIYQDNIGNCTSGKDNAAQILTDTNLNTGVSVDAPNGFTVDSSAGYSDIVTIQFSAGPGLGIAGAFANQIDPVNFQTTVSLRGYTEIR